MRACLLATELARRAGLDDGDRRDVYYAALMRFAGCAATSHEMAATLGGDDVVARARGDLIDPSRPAEAMRFPHGPRRPAYAEPRAGHGPLRRRRRARRLRGRGGADGAPAAARSRAPGRARRVRAL